MSDHSIFDRLVTVETRYDELNGLLSDPDVISDTQRFMKLSKEEAQLRETVHEYGHYKEVLEGINEIEEMLHSGLESDMEALAKEELAQLKAEQETLEERLKILLLPKDVHDDRNIIMEIRGAAGGDEAQLFARDLFEMYHKYADNQGWRTEVLDASSTGVGGFKEVIFSISGENVYSKLKFENGAHRVQRVPETESQGRIHTSTATVVVMPEAEDVEVDIDPNDIRVDIYHASGAGGQHVNKTASAVRLTHEPTGIVVAMQDERSQIKNREKAMKVLRSRVYDKITSEHQAELDAERKSAIGTGDRSERIRTYNFPQSRVTDHRINLTIQQLDNILGGDLGQVVDELVIWEQTEKLEKLKHGG